MQYTMTNPMTKSTAIPTTYNPINNPMTYRISIPMINPMTEKFWISGHFCNFAMFWEVSQFHTLAKFWIEIQHYELIINITTFNNENENMFWYIFGSINGVAEMKKLNINIKSNHRKLCQQRKQQSFIKHFNVLPVIGHFFSSFFENFHDIPPPLQNLSMKHWKKLHLKHLKHLITFEWHLPG